MKINYCEFPDQLLYDLENGTWLRVTEGKGRLGINTITSWSSGTFQSVSLKDTGTAVEKGQVIGSFDASRHFDVVRSPVKGTIVKRNPLLQKEPELLNRDPYGDGWLLELQIHAPDELGSLDHLPEAESKIKSLIIERKVRCFAAFPDHEMFDIGVECAAVLVKLNELLANSKPGTVVHVVSDDTSADIEMQRWADQTGNSVLDWRKEGTFYHFIVRKQ